MRKNKLTAGFLLFGFTLAAAELLFAGDPAARQVDRRVGAPASAERGMRISSAKAGRRPSRTAPADGVASTGASRTARPRVLVTPAPELKGIISAASVAGGTPPGTTVYRNEIDPITAVFTPGPGERMADQLNLAGGGCAVSYYAIGVFGFADSADPDFTVQTEFWDGDPCLGTSSPIAGTAAEGVIPNDQSPFLFEVLVDPPVAVPGQVWLAVTFSNNDGGWIIAEAAELGSTPNLFSEDDSVEGCAQFVFIGNPPPHAGLWATVNCNLASDPTGACCDGTTCAEATEADCTATGGSWLGAFTTCTPNPCLTGACCTGSNFQACSETSQAECTTGLFDPSLTCADDPCGPTYVGFANNFNTGAFSGIDEGNMWADDIKIEARPSVAGTGVTACELAGYDILVTGDPSGPSTFDVRTELWTNDALGTVDEIDDAPLEPITGTAQTFLDVPADRFPHRLVAGEFSGIVLPQKVWLALSVDPATSTSGPLLAGFPAKLGASKDAFARFNGAAWTGRLVFCDPADPQNCGFDPTGCPTNVNTCIPAGSFRINLWCHGDRPTGACCDDGTGACVDGVTALVCPGRFVAGATCDSGVFEPVCGTNACCFPNPANPSVPFCSNLTLEECAVEGGAVSAGNSCNEITCPSVDCLGRTGDCFVEHSTPGCDDAFCCDRVCLDDPNCCNTSFRWDDVCVQEAEMLCTTPPANDDLADAEPLTGEGAFAFDNTLATTDGPTSEGCSGIDGIADITNDVWYCWTASCTDIVFVSTCSQTDDDTKIAVYEDCSQPPAEGSLLACSDDACNLQSRASFQALAGQTYLIRVGNFPGMDGGEGNIEISCGPPNNTACPGTVDCCVGNPPAQPDSPGCSDEACCERVCLEDPFCCETDWDELCAGGTGAAGHCPELCGTCPVGRVAWLDPPNGTIDAGWHVDPQTGEQLGIQTIVMRGPADAHGGCFSLCETADGGSPNSIASVVEDQPGIYTITLARPITPNAVTTVTYTAATGETNTIELISHPGNTNGDNVADGNDLLGLSQFLVTGSAAAVPWGLFSFDVDRNGRFLPADLLAEVEALRGDGMLDPPALNTTLPEAGDVCP